MFVCICVRNRGGGAWGERVMCVSICVEVLT